MEIYFLTACSSPFFSVYKVLVSETVFLQQNNKHFVGLKDGLKASTRISITNVA